MAMALPKGETAFSILDSIKHLDLYVLLGTQPEATNEEIKKAYEERAVKWWHNNPEDFQLLLNAFTVLSDRTARFNYDGILKARKAKNNNDDERGIEMKREGEFVEGLERKQCKKEEAEVAPEMQILTDKDGRWTIYSYRGPAPPSTAAHLTGAKNNNVDNGKGIEESRKREGEPLEGLERKKWKNEEPIRCKFGCNRDFKTQEAMEQHCKDAAVHKNTTKYIARKVTGIVKWFDIKGYGVIARNDIQDEVFVNISAIAKKNPNQAARSLGEGETVEFDVVEGGKKGNVARNVTGPGGVPVKGDQRPNQTARLRHLGQGGKRKRGPRARGTKKADRIAQLLAEARYHLKQAQDGMKRKRARGANKSGGAPIRCQFGCNRAFKFQGAMEQHCKSMHIKRE